MTTLHPERQTVIPFTHLHLHTPRSRLDGFVRIKDLIKLALEYGMDAVGVSEHGNMASHFEFYSEAKKAGLHPVLGMEAYITPHRSWTDSNHKSITYLERPATDMEYVTLTSRGWKKPTQAALQAATSVEDLMDPVMRETPAEPVLINNFYLLEEEQLQADSSFVNVRDLKPKKVADEYAKQARAYLAADLITEHFQETHGFLSLKDAHKQAQALWTSFTRQKRYLCVKMDSRQRDLFEWRPKLNHLLLVAMNNEGYRNLLKLNYIGQIEGFYRKPRVDYEAIKEYGKGIAATSACLGGEIPQLILRGRYRVARNLARFYQKCFERFYFEIQPSNQPEQYQVNQVLIQWSQEMGIPLIATSDVHMLKKEELDIHAQFTVIGKSSKKDDQDENDISVYESCYFMHPQEMLEKGIPQIALQNAYDLSHACQVTLDNDELKFPVYNVPDGYDFDSYLAHLAHSALFQKYLELDFDLELYTKRMNYELEVIRMKNLSAYFIIVWDYINEARKRKILVGPGRGSAAGSLVSWMLGITNIDPVRWNLLFTRMLNPERESMPDDKRPFVMRVALPLCELLEPRASASTPSLRAC